MFEPIQKLGFEFRGNGLWVHREKEVCIALDDAYRTTWRAYDQPRPWWRSVLRNVNGNDIRFRSPVAAAKAALASRPER